MAIYLLLQSADCGGDDLLHLAACTIAHEYANTGRSIGGGHSRRSTELAERKTSGAQRSVYQSFPSAPTVSSERSWWENRYRIGHQYPEGWKYSSERTH